MPTIRAISDCFPPQLKKKLMPLRGLKDLQFTMNYFNPFTWCSAPFTWCSAR